MSFRFDNTSVIGNSWLLKLPLLARSGQANSAEGPLRARSGPYNYEQMDIQVMPSTLKKDALMRIRIRILSGVFMILLVVAF